MRYTMREWGYPNSTTEGLEKNKRWYEFQLIKNESGVLTEEEYNALMVELICNQGGTTEEIEGGTQINLPNKEYMFFN